MKPMIDQAFWSDPDIEGAKAGVKLTALWLITNSQTNLLGVCGASEGRFKFETGLDDKALTSTLEALPRAFTRVGSLIFVRNYIRHQFGSGEKLKRNNFFVALKSLFVSIKDEELKVAVLKEYPEFNEALMEGFEGLTKPQLRKGKKEGVQGKPIRPLPGSEEYLESLSSNLAYQGIDVRREWHKMQAWCSETNNPASGKRFLNWLNKADRTIKPNSNGKPKFLTPEEHRAIQAKAEAESERRNGTH